MITSVVLLFLFAIAIEANPVLRAENEDVDLTFPELVTKYGYPVENHYVTTSDGYILQLHRISHGRNSDTPNKRVLLLMHGVLSSSIDWIINGPDLALGYIMADEGYDVWFGNARGNSFSRNHTSLNPDKDADFWDFSWHEIGTIDLPQTIDYILKETGVDSIFYAGHSQGTTSFYVMTSSLPEYNAKIKVHISLAPVAFMGHMTSPLLRIVALWDGPLSILMSLLGIHEFMPSSDFLNMVGPALCGEGTLSQLVCKNALFAVCGFNAKQTNNTLLPIILSHTPAGSATKQLLHYGQGINSGHFRQYDYGMVGNLNRYGSIFAPDYKLNQITAPVYQIYSHNDWLSAETDVAKLCNNLGNCKGKFLVSDDKFNHLDYLYGIDAPKLVYKTVISLMSRF